MYLYISFVNSKTRIAKLQFNGKLYNFFSFRGENGTKLSFKDEILNNNARNIEFSSFGSNF